MFKLRSTLRSSINFKAGGEVHGTFLSRSKHCRWIRTLYIDFCSRRRSSNSRKHFQWCFLFSFFLYCQWLIAIRRSAVTYGAGVQWREAYASADQQGLFIVGGISLGGSVGAAGGWVMGGGHSALSPKFGLGIAIHIYSTCALIYDMTVQVLITFFSLLLSLPMDLSSPPTPSNTQICFGHYVVVAEVLTAS